MCQRQSGLASIGTPRLPHKAGKEIAASHPVNSGGFLKQFIGLDRPTTFLHEARVGGYLLLSPKMR